MPGLLDTGRKQILNCATAQSIACRSGVDWLLCNLDLDEAVCFSAGGVAQHFHAVPAEVSQIVYINHEAIVADAESGSQTTWFDQIEHFKISPVLKLPFIGRRFPSDEEPQILDHPEGIGEKTLRFWQAHNARLSHQYNFKKRSGGNTCSYFDGYMRGKAAVRVKALDSAVPRVHRWHGDLQTVVCHPGVVSLLHYINCGGLDWFEAKYQIRGSEEANRLWFHVLAQERARVGREALKELYDDILSIPRPDLDQQISEGFVAPLKLSIGETAETQCLASVHQGFWGWAVVGLGDQLYVHMPLASALNDSLQPDLQDFLGQAVIHQLSPGEVMELNVGNSGVVPVLVSEIPKQRGCLLLDVLPSQRPPTAGIFLAVSMTAPGDQPGKTPNFQWLSTVNVGPSSGWRCRIQTHPWPEYSSTVAIWVLTATETFRPSAVAHSAAVVFEELKIDSQSGQKCSAQLSFEHETTWLPSELHFSYAAFYAAYGAIDGRAIAEEATGSSSIELTYAEIEFAPFYDLLAQVAQPQPGDSSLSTLRSF